ncbi:MAG TPA: hypothetical protein VHD14_12610 [Pseudolabrys sp.]|jgi:hypothetical protein|nr:hypothetical protein [Pseudolabrys sp.]
MTTLQLRAQQAQTGFGDFLSYLGSVIDAVFDVFEEAHKLAREAHRRYPFADY